MCNHRQQLELQKLRKKQKQGKTFDIETVMWRIFLEAQTLKG